LLFLSALSKSLLLVAINSRQFTNSTLVFTPGEILSEYEFRSRHRTSQLSSPNAVPLNSVRITAPRTAQDEQSHDDVRAASSRAAFISSGFCFLSCSRASFPASEFGVSSPGRKSRAPQPARRSCLISHGCGCVRDVLKTNRKIRIIIVVDPLPAYLGESQAQKNVQVRKVLTPLIKLVEDCGVLVIGVTHLNKSAGNLAPPTGGGRRL
jgi:hypothetical protein